jgi:CBS domain-containing protein
MRYGITAREAMTKHPVTIRPGVSVVNAVQRMLKENVGSLLVIEDKKLVGIVTEKDILIKVIAQQMDPKKTKVREVMTKDVITIAPDTDLYEIAKLMNEEDIRRLPVIEGGKLVGLITEKDLLKIEPSLLDVLIERMKIREPEIKPIIEEASLQGACEICGNYCEDLEEMGGMLICSLCKESME